MRLYAEMLEECRKDLANVLELIEIEKKRGRKRLTPLEHQKHNQRLETLYMERAELEYKVGMLMKKVNKRR